MTKLRQGLHRAAGHQQAWQKNVNLPQMRNAGGIGGVLEIKKKRSQVEKACGRFCGKGWKCLRMCGEDYFFLPMCGIIIKNRENCRGSRSILWMWRLRCKYSVLSVGSMFIAANILLLKKWCTHRQLVWPSIIWSAVHYKWWYTNKNVKDLFELVKATGIRKRVQEKSGMKK